MSESDTTSDTEDGADALGLTDVAASPVERVAVRRRESQVTTSAWRLAVTCAEGTGAIVRVDASASESIYRGDGLFLGWPQARLAQVYETLTRPTGGSDSDLELLQLG